MNSLNICAVYSFIRAAVDALSPRGAPGWRRGATFWALLGLLCSPLLDGSVAHADPSCTFREATGNCNEGEYFGGDYHTCVGSNGGEFTHNLWPSGLIAKLWDHCSENGCDGEPVKLGTTSGTSYCNGGLGSKYTVFARATGSYCGWNDRNNFLNEAIATHEGNGGWVRPFIPFVQDDGWNMPSNLWLRNYQDGGWINMEFHSVCHGDGADVTEKLLNATSLDWAALLRILHL